MQIKIKINIEWIKYRISPFECWLSSEHLVSNERRVKRGHYDHERSKIWVSNERQGTEILKLMSAEALIRANMVTVMHIAQVNFESSTVLPKLPELLL